MPTYDVKVTAQITRTFTVENAEDELDAREIAEFQLLDDYAVTKADGSGIAWDLVESVQSTERE